MPKQSFKEIGNIQPKAEVTSAFIPFQTVLIRKWPEPVTVKTDIEKEL